MVIRSLCSGHEILDVAEQLRVGVYNNNSNNNKIDLYSAVVS